MDLRSSSDHHQSGSQLDLTAGGSLPEQWTRLAVEDPEVEALCFEGIWHTRGELERLTVGQARSLASRGVSAGDRILFSTGTSREATLLHLGALRLGAIVVPTNPAYTRKELTHIAKDSDPIAFICDSDERSSWIVDACPSAQRLIGNDSDEVALDGADVGWPQLDQPAMLPYTSGTTGAPKGALLTHGNLAAGARSLVHAWRWSPSDRLVLALPLFHMHGLGVGLHGTLTAGGSAVVLPDFDVDTVLDVAKRTDATLFFGVPTMYQRIVSSGRARDLGLFRLCVSGSAPLPPDRFHAIHEATGASVLERYGMTETLMNVSNPHDMERRAGTVGIPLPGVEVKLDSQSSEILLRGPNVFGGYWNRPEATAEAFEDGWFRSGDIGEVDDHGYLRIVGRLKELIISGGYNVYPREVEDVIRTAAGVADVAVVGVPDERWGEVVTAFVVPIGVDLDETAIRAACEEQLAAYKRPRTINFVSDLPRNSMGKVVRARLPTVPAQSSEQSAPAAPPPEN